MKQITLRRVRLLAGVLAAATIIPPAHAADYLFRISGDANYDFSLDTSSPYETHDHYITFDDVAGFPTASGTASVDLFDSFDRGGLELDDRDGGTKTAFYLADGPQLFSMAGGGVNFLAGTYTLDGTRYGCGISTLTITAAPEPAVWALMLIGFGSIGATMRRQRVTVAYA